MTKCTILCKPTSNIIQGNKAIIIDTLPKTSTETPEEAEKRINPWFLEYSNKDDFDKLFEIKWNFNHYTWSQLPEMYFKKWSRYLYVETKARTVGAASLDNSGKIETLSQKYPVSESRYSMTRKDRNWDISTITFAQINK